MNALATGRVDTNLLRKLYQTDDAARAVFDHFARRERNWKEQNVDRLLRNIAKEGSQASRSDVVRVLKSLEKAGCGKFIVGRGGHPSRFRWDVEMVAVGGYAAGQPTVIEEIDPGTPTEEEAERVSESLPSRGVQEITHTFRLRPDLPITFGLPVDLTAAEAARLSDFIKTLPFDGTAETA
jgi:hypothetical protein